MKTAFLLLFAIPQILFAQTDSLTNETSQEEINKEIAKNFYEDLWFNNRTENYSKYVAEEYTRRDIGDTPDQEAEVEKAISQKEVADRFWDGGTMTGFIDYQIADGDRVATRWYWTYKPESLMAKFMVGEHTIPIINVFKFKDGKIVEIHNHRHDISLNFTNMFLLKGLGIGLLIALVPTFLAIYYRRKLKKATQTVNA
ncbi:MAG: hypothetical protein CMO01_18670 [Thalassobius sp.]|nr:hypothetical protein [Thalassovita sp.]